MIKHTLKAYTKIAFRWSSRSVSVQTKFFSSTVNTLQDFQRNFLSRIGPSNNSADSSQFDGFMQEIFPGMPPSQKTSLILNWMIEEVSKGNGDSIDTLTALLEDHSASLDSLSNIALLARILRTFERRIEKDFDSKIRLHSKSKSRLQALAQSSLKALIEKNSQLADPSHAVRTRRLYSELFSQSLNRESLSEKVFVSLIEDKFKEISSLNNTDSMIVPYETALDINYAYKHLSNAEEFQAKVQKILLHSLRSSSLSIQLDLLRSLNLSSRQWNGTFALEVEKSLAFAIEAELGSLDLLALLQFVCDFKNCFRGKFAFKVREAVLAKESTAGAKEALFALVFLWQSQLNDAKLIKTFNSVLLSQGESLMKEGEAFVLMVLSLLENNYFSPNLKEKVASWTKKTDVNELSPSAKIQLYLIYLAHGRSNEAAGIAKALDPKDIRLTKELVFEVVERAGALTDQAVLNKASFEKHLRFLFDVIVPEILQSKQFSQNERKYLRDVISQVTDAYDERLEGAAGSE